MPIFQKVTICWYLLVLSVRVTSEQWSVVVITEFNRGVLGAMGGTCLGRDLLAVKEYEDFVSVFEKPVGANDFFATSLEGINEYCIENSGTFIADVDYEVGVLIHTGNIEDSNLFSLSVIDMRNSEVLTDVEEETYEENWTYSIIKIKRQSSYKVSICSFDVFTYEYYYHKVFMF